MTLVTFIPVGMITSCTTLHYTAISSDSYRLLDIQSVWCTASGERLHEQTEARLWRNVQLLAPAAAPIALAVPAAAARSGRPSRLRRGRLWNTQWGRARRSASRPAARQRRGRPGDANGRRVAARHDAAAIAARDARCWMNSTILLPAGSLLIVDLIDHCASHRMFHVPLRVQYFTMSVHLWSFNSRDWFRNLRKYESLKLMWILALWLLWTWDYSVLDYLKFISKYGLH